MIDNTQDDCLRNNILYIARKLCGRIIIRFKCFELLNREMKTFKLWIFFLFIGMLSILSQCSEIERTLEFNGHKSGIYLVDNENSAGEFKNGISYMFQKINDAVTIHALFHYRHNIFAANITQGMLSNAIQSKLQKNGAKINVDWKEFLVEELKNIEKRMMKPGLTNDQARSRTSAAIVIVDGNTVIQAQIGDSRIVSFAKDSQQSETGLRIKKMASADIKGRLGGQFFKNKDSTIRGNADVTDLSDVRFIVMGITYFWFTHLDTVAQILSQNVNNLNKAALEVTKLIEIPDYEAKNGVIVIGLNPSVTILAARRNIKLTLTKKNELMPVSVKFNSDRELNVATKNRVKRHSLQ